MRKLLFSILAMSFILLGNFNSTLTNSATLVAQSTEYNSTNGFPIQPPV